MRKPIASLVLGFMIAVSGLQARAAADVLDMDLPGLNQPKVSLSDYRGRWVVLNLWATWCPPCIEEMPELEAFHQRYGKEIPTIGVNYEFNEIDTLKSFVSDIKVTFPIALSGGEPLAGFPGLVGLPTTYIIDPEGRLAKTHSGPLTMAFLERLLMKLGSLPEEVPKPI